MDILSRRIRDLRIDRDMKQGELGAALGITQNMVSNYENGREPPLETVLLYAEYFDVSLEYLVGLTNERKPVRDSLTMEFYCLENLTVGKAPTASAMLAFLNAVKEYYHNNAPCGDVPLHAFNGFLDGLSSALRAATRDDDTALIDSVNAATIAALEVAAMPGVYYKGKKQKGEDVP